MSIFSELNASASALTANRLRMDVTASNIANANTTRAQYINGEWQPYRRKMVNIAPDSEKQFSIVFQKALNTNSTGVKVTGIEEDSEPFKLVYEPSHPDANDQGYVQLPNVDPLKEMTDLMSASRSYEANVTALNATKGMLVKALEIGK
ncbi:flagellar basal body rod protein FlgC [Priestia filamentosa]|uniref:flagellar basal body rod protein FlgC n=1 Tax=Priestia filamentosa TaxID=1402861 RepID=UPI00030F1715|nr:flagellar basal body rod protein FlgC [Priestia filamentosa]